MMRLQDPVRALSGIGPKTEPLFQKLGIRTIGDLLLYYPFRYDHYTEPQAIRSLVPGKSAVIEASLSKTPTFHNAGGRKLMLCEVSDGTGSVELAWFQMTYMKNRLKPGMHFFFRGKVELRGRKLHMNHPEVLTKEQMASIVSHNYSDQALAVMAEFEIPDELPPEPEINVRPDENGAQPYQFSRRRSSGKSCSSG